MRVLFLIPKSNPPELQGNYTKLFKEFVALCLNKDPKNRPSGKELLKHRFIKNAKKNSCLVDLIERFRRWKAAGGDSEDDLSDNELERDDQGEGEDDAEWNFAMDTVRAPKEPSRKNVLPESSQQQESTVEQLSLIHI